MHPSGSYKNYRAALRNAKVKIRRLMSLYLPFFFSFMIINVFQLPLLPFLGMYLSDLTFVEVRTKRVLANLPSSGDCMNMSEPFECLFCPQDGNPDFIDGKINWAKRELMYLPPRVLLVLSPMCAPPASLTRPDTKSSRRSSCTSRPLTNSPLSSPSRHSLPSCLLLLKRFLCDSFAKKKKRKRNTRRLTLAQELYELSLLREPRTPTGK
jgi:hypothetical protein